MSPPRSSRHNPTAFMRALGASVRARRMRLRQTRVELARRVGVTENTIIQIEAGELNLDLLQLVKLSEALELPLRILLRRVERQIGWVRKKKKRRSVSGPAKKQNDGQ